MKLFFLICLLVVAGGAERSRLAATAGTARERVAATALAEVGTTEATGNNDGPVDKYLASVGLGGTRNPYCAAYVYWVGKTALGTTNPFPRSAWSPDFVSRPTWIKGVGMTPQPGDAFGIYFPSKGRVAHTGLVVQWGSKYCRTAEANTSRDAGSGTAADRDGGGVWSKWRPLRTIHSTKSWLPN